MKYMNINKKIEKIRQKPEYERVRYVWGMVAIAMFFIIILWIVSLKDTFKNSNQPSISDSIYPQQVNLEGIAEVE